MYERRVVGVMVEKAKTTPDAYPLTLNALRNGCNQKSNRAPVLSMDETHVEDALEKLRAYGAVMEIQGDGRVPKFRHMLYEWLGVEKVEMAVMVELLLRGAQTVGELRGRAARMEPIPDLAALWPILESLQRKKLLIFLSPRGRGCTVTHALYLPNELEKVKLQFAHSAGAADPDESEAATDHPSFQAPNFPSTALGPISHAVGSSATAALTAELDVKLTDLRTELTTCQSELDELRTQFSALQADVERIRSELGI
jgi:uncharacterized protein YceH (UPF0502 family)